MPDGIRPAATPSPDKGRAGEGFAAATQKHKFHAYDPRLTAFARANRKVPTPAETLLWQKVLRGKQFGGYKFLRQKPIGPYVVDFYCAALNLLIEIDGDILNNLPGVYAHLQQQLEQSPP